MTQSSAANTPPPPTWILANLGLADGTTLQLRLSNVVSWSVANYEPRENEEPSITRIDIHGRRRRGRLSQILGDGA